MTKRLSAAKAMAAKIHPVTDQNGDDGVFLPSSFCFLERREDSKMFYKKSMFTISARTNKNGTSILYNSYTGAVCQLEDHYLKLLDFPKIKPDDVPKDLIRLGFVVPESLDEYGRVLQERHELQYDSNCRELSYVLASTLACNLRCSYCYEEGRTAVTMTPEIWKGTLEFIEKQIILHRALALHIVLFGGEPMFTYDATLKFLDKLIAFCDANGTKFTASMISNAVLLTGEKAEQLSKRHVLKTQITLDGLAPLYAVMKRTTENTFYTVLEHIQEASKYMRINVRINATRQNRDDIIPLAKLLEFRGIITDNVFVYIAQVRDLRASGIANMLTDKEYMDLRDEFGDYMRSRGHEKNLRIHQDRPPRKVIYCGSMRCNSSAIIGPGGELYRCEHCVGMKGWEIGDVFSGYYHNEVDRRFMELQLPEKCQRCCVLPLCMGDDPSFRLFDHAETDCDAIRGGFIKRILIATDKKLAVEESGPASEECC
jgi:uncharacterized protein